MHEHQNLYLHKLENILILLKRKNKNDLPATRVPEVIVSTLMTIPRDGRALRNMTPSNKLAIGTHLLIALYIGMFIPLRANKAYKILSETIKKY